MLEGKLAVVTGAAAGLGFGIAECMSREGARVVVADIDPAAAQGAAGTLRAKGADAVGIRVDVASSAEVAALFQQLSATLGTPDILVNNAGIVSQQAVLDITEAELDRVIAVNLKGVFLCSQAAARLMIPKGGGRIINIASTAARVSAPGFALYSASKGGVAALTRALAVEWARHLVLVNSISPGSMETSMSQASRKQDPEAFARRDRRVPISRPGWPEDIGNAAAFLASERSGYITGHDILVDGGMLAQHPGYVP